MLYWCPLYSVLSVHSIARLAPILRSTSVTSSRMLYVFWRTNDIRKWRKRFCWRIDNIIDVAFFIYLFSGAPGYAGIGSESGPLSALDRSVHGKTTRGGQARASQVGIFLYRPFISIHKYTLVFDRPTYSVHIDRGHVTFEQKNGIPKEQSICFLFGHPRKSRDRDGYQPYFLAWICK